MRRNEVRRRPARSRVAEQAATGAQLVVLVDGEWRGRWYWLEDFRQVQRAAARYPITHPAGVMRGYLPTGEDARPHPTTPGVSGIVYRFQPERAERVTVPAPRQATPDRAATEAPRGMVVSGPRTGTRG